MNILDSLSQLASAIDPGVSPLSFAIYLPDRSLSTHDFTLACETGEDGAITFSGSNAEIHLAWRFAPARGGYRVTLSVSGDRPFACQRIDSLIVAYAPSGNLTDWRIPTLGEGVESVGMPRVAQLDETLGDHPIQSMPGASKYAVGSLLRGAFPDSGQPGLFLGTLLPQNYRHLYTIEPLGPDRFGGNLSGLVFTASTHFLAAGAPSSQYTSEITWVCANLPIREAIAAYADHFSPLPTPCDGVAVGWNSWDYYFSAVRQEDILENTDFIRADAQLSQAIKYIVVDMGWEHCWGEWYSNYRFPDGLEYLANEITTRGFVPGIWTAPLVVHPLSYPGLCIGEMVIKNEHGDPWPSLEGGQYAIDPTHPAGQAFLRGIFTRLHYAGFRFFKIDYVSTIVSAPRFHDPQKGPYGALSDFFRQVRECVGLESHILGCSLPTECGPGLADSRRTGIDIHNQWTHIEWALDFYQFAYWQSDRIAVNDPDFLVMRGRDTSLETETNVLNPNAHNPHPPRWRRGPVFSLDEARTWATFVSLVGSNVFLSDRMTMLNEAGMELIHKVFTPSGVSAIPLDLADGERPSLWYASFEGESRLGIINWQNTPVTHKFVFTEWVIPSPQSVTDFWMGKTIPVADGNLTIILPAHASAYVKWQPAKR